MDDDKLNYLISLQEANLQIAAQNNVLLQNIINKLDDPKNDIKALLIDLIGNMAVYKAVDGRIGADS
jgi:hypothetical protein